MLKLKIGSPAGDGGSWIHSHNRRAERRPAVSGFGFTPNGAPYGGTPLRSAASSGTSSEPGEATASSSSSTVRSSAAFSPCT
jgi:hypothetical protein